MITSHRLHHFSLVTLLTFTGGTFANAAPRTWSGTTDGNWSVGDVDGNWTDAPAPVNNDTLTFAGTTNTATTNTATTNDIIGLTVGAANNSNTTVVLSFPNSGDGESFTLDGNAVNLNGSINSSNVANGSSITDVINLDVVLTGNGNRRITTGNNHHLTINGLVSGGGNGGTFIMEKAAGGTTGIVSLTNDANSFIKNLSVFDGHARVTSIGAQGIDSAAGAGTFIQVGSNNPGINPTLEYLGSGNSSSDRTIVLNGGNNSTAHILNNGTGTLTLSGAFNSSNTNGTQTKTLNLGGTNNGNNTVSGVLDDQGGGASTGTLNVSKSDSGLWILSGANTYTGNTIVNDGTLQIDNAFLDDASTVTIASGAVMNLNFAGSDTIASLQLGEEVFTSGTFSASSPAPYDAFFAGGGELTVSSASPYDTWAMGPFANPFTDTDPEVDFDNDGLSNLLEFVLGGDPTISQPGIAPTASETGSDLVVTFMRSDISLLSPSTSVTMQVSDDLVSWPVGNDIVIGTTSDAGPIGDTGASYTVTDGDPLDTIVVTIPNGAATKRFTRVLANQP